jgi:hypothetical protein
MENINILKVTKRRKHMRRKKHQHAIRRQKIWYNVKNSIIFEPCTDGAQPECLHTVHKTPINFFFLDSPFSLQAVIAEDLMEGGDECWQAKSITPQKPIALKDIADVSVRMLMGPSRCDHKNRENVINHGDACASVDYTGMGASRAVSLYGNAAVSGEHAVAISMGDHKSAVASGLGSHAIAVEHGGNAATSGYWSHAVTVDDGWAISGKGNAVALEDGKAVCCGSQGMAIACREAYAFGIQGRAVACTDWGSGAAATASGKWGEAIALGQNSKAACSGTYGLAIATGLDGKAKGALGCWLVLAQRDRREKPVSVMTVQVDGERIKPDTWYTMRKGKIVPVSEEEIKENNTAG